MSLINDNLGQIIKEARMAQRIRRSELAERVGISYRYLQNIENTNKRPSYKVLASLVRELGISLDDAIYHERLIATDKKTQITEKINRCSEDNLTILDTLLDALLRLQNKDERLS